MRRIPAAPSLTIFWVLMTKITCPHPTRAPSRLPLADAMRRSVFGQRNAADDIVKRRARVRIRAAAFRSIRYSRSRRGW